MGSQFSDLLLSGSVRKVITSERQLVDELLVYQRPIVDVAFESPNSVTASFAAFRVENLLFTETIADSIFWKTAAHSQLSFVLPIKGGGRLIERQQSLEWGDEHKMLQFPYANSMESYSEELHAVAVIPDIQELTASLALLQPDGGDIIARATSEMAEVHSGIFNGIDYLSQLRSLIAIATMSSGNAEHLVRIGFTDVFNRVLANLLIDKEHRRSDPQAQVVATRSRRAVDMICSHIRASMGKPLTTPNMEALTGMTGRALNYAFQERFNCSPQQWQRRELLTEARRLILNPENMQSIKAISQRLGFSSPHSFSSHYRRQFGELPSFTGNTEPSTGKLLDNAESTDR